MRITKKILAIALSILMAISMMPFTAFAASTIEVSENLQTAIENAAASDTLKLTADIDVTSTLTVDKTLTINLNGYNINSTAAGSAFLVETTGKLTIKDSTAKSLAVANDYSVSYTSGKVYASTGSVVLNKGTFTLSSGIISSRDGSGYAAVDTYDNSTTTISGGWAHGGEDTIRVARTNAKVTVSGGVLDSYDNGVIMENGSSGLTGNTITVKGGTLIGRIVTAGYVACGIYHSNANTLNISGGKIVAINGVGVLVRAGDVNITGGEIVTTGTATGKVGDSRVVVPCSAVCVDTGSSYPGASSDTVVFDVDITSGTFTSEVDAVQTVGETAVSKIEVTGGTYSSDVSELFSEDASYYTIPDGSNEKVIITADTAAIYKGSKGWTPTNGVMYALACAANNTTVYVVKNVDDDTWTGSKFGAGSQPWLRGNNNITLDLQGYNVTSNYGSETETTVNPSIKMGNSRGTTDQLNIVSSTPATLTLKYGIRLGDSNTLTVGENVTLKSTNSSYTAFIDSNATNSAIVVNGTVVNENANGAALYINGTVKDSSNAITVNGTVEGGAAGVYGAGKGTYTINGDVSGATGVYLAQGNLVVNDGAEINGTGDVASYKYDGSGFNATGDAIVIDNKYATAPTATINGGTILSEKAKAVGNYGAADDATSGKTTAAITSEIVPATSTAKFSDNELVLIPEGKELVQNTDGTYSLNDIEPVPQADVTDAEAPAGASFAYKFTAPHTAENVDASKYATYRADFVATFDRDIKAGEVTLYGKYGETGWVDFTIDRDVRAGEEFRVYKELTNDTLTYATICKEVSPFYCGAGGEVLADTNMSVTLKLYPVEGGVEGTPVDASRTVTDAIDEPVPQADVTDAEAPAGASFAYKFTAPHTAENVDASKYATYRADFVATFDRDIKAGEVTLYGKYGETGWVDLTIDRDVRAGEEFRVYKELTNDTLTYATICKEVSPFYCGAGGEVLANTNMSVTLKLYPVEGGVEGTPVDASRTVTDAIEKPAVTPAVDEQSITVSDKIDLNVYVAITSEVAALHVTYNGTPDEQTNVAKEETIQNPTADADGQYAIEVPLAPAQIRDTITIEVLRADNTIIRTIETSVAKYCEDILERNAYNGANKDAVKALAQATLDYGKAASDYFGYNTEDEGYRNYTIQGGAATFSGLVTDASGITISGVSYVAKSIPELRFTVTVDEETAKELTATTDKGYAASFAKVDGTDKIVLQVTGIPASKLNEKITITVSDGSTIEYTPLAWAKAAANSGKEKLAALGNAVANYSYAAANVF